MINEVDLEKRKIILDAFQSGLTKIQARDAIIDKFGNCDGYRERTCDRWFSKFRNGNFDLIEKPRDKVVKGPYIKRKRPTKKINKVVELIFKQKVIPNSMETNKNLDFQNLIQKKRELTISKISTKTNPPPRKLPVEPNIITKRLIPSSGPPKLIPVTSSTPTPPPFDSTDKTNLQSNEMPKLRPRRIRSRGIEIQLPASAAARMTSETLTENHSIGEVHRNSTRSAALKNSPQKSPTPKNVTVQFQNISPQITKSTICKSTRLANREENKVTTHLKRQNPIKQADNMLKIAKVAHIESMSPEKNKISEQMPTDVSIKRNSPAPTALSPLTNPKGIIYLNPQEIFPQNFGGFRNAKSNVMKRPTTSNKPLQQKLQQQPIATPTQPVPTPPPDKIDSIVLSDSDDAEADLVLPKNIPLPAPKIKTETFATYWDMENENSLVLNEDNVPVLSKTSTSVIEID